MTQQNNSIQFKENQRQHALILTTHGVHEWQVIPGLQDTGGQNIFVNQFAEELANQGWKITIINRGGYPHPQTGKLQAGIHYADANRRLVYLDDGFPEFVPKEDMDSRTSACANSLFNFWQTEENLQIDLVISNYWDAAVIAGLFLHKSSLTVPHIWIPHSLGAIKKKNVSPEKWMELRIHQRVSQEILILENVDWVASTSPAITQTLNKEYQYTQRLLWLPPCIQDTRFFPHDVSLDIPLWRTLAQSSELSIREIQQRKIISEISRTDTTKRKDILLKAYTRIKDKHPDTLLAISIDTDLQPTGRALSALIEELDLKGHIAVLGSIQEILPDLYAASHIYCTPSIMEGFGMSAQEAAASGVPVIASSLVPFVSEYLQSGMPQKPIPKVQSAIRVAEASVLVQPDDIAGFAEALDILLKDQDLCKQMGKAAYSATIPQFTWGRVVENFLKDIRGQ